VEMVDAKGEKLHQVLMPKKMQRLDESTDYRPFKFRIQAFTNSFSDEVSLSRTWLTLACPPRNNGRNHVGQKDQIVSLETRLDLTL
jgi:hypothetical protein